MTQLTDAVSAAERIDAALAAFAESRPARPGTRRGSGAHAGRVLRRRPRPAGRDHRRTRPTATTIMRRWPPTRSSPACWCCTTCIRRARSSGCRPRWSGSVPTSVRTPATSTCSASTTTAWCACAWPAAATAARRRRSPSRLAIEQAIEEAAPEVVRVEVEGVAAPPLPRGVGGPGGRTLLPDARHVRACRDRTRDAAASPGCRWRIRPTSRPARSPATVARRCRDCGREPRRRPVRLPRSLPGLRRRRCAPACSTATC